MRLLSVGLGSLLVTGVVFVAAATAIAPGSLIAGLFGTSTDNAYVRGDITPISPRVSGYIVEAPVRDNQAVRKDDILFRIDDRDFRARVEQAAANIATRKAMIDTLSRQIELQRAVLEQADAALRAAQADANRAARDYKRIQDLSGHGWASEASRDQSEADHLRAGAKIAEAEASVVAARRQMSVLESQRPQLEAEIAAATAAWQLAQIELENTTIRSPSDGWLGERQARVGQFVRPGSLLVALVPQDVWVVANFKETQVPALQIGDGVTVMVDGVPGVEFRGLIDSLSPASGAQFALLPPDNATGNFTRIVQRIPVKIKFEPGQSALDHLRPGMSAVVVASSEVQRSAVSQNGIQAHLSGKGGPAPE